MKKLLAILLMGLLMLTISQTADAKTGLTRPDLRNVKTVAAMKEGTYSWNGVKFTTTVETAKKKWGKQDYSFTSMFTRYDHTLEYYYSNDDMIQATFTGARNLKKSKYGFTSLNYQGDAKRFKYKDMIKYWGAEPDFEYQQYDTDNYIYGHMIFTYDAIDGAFMGYNYMDTMNIRAMKQIFAY